MDYNARVELDSRDFDESAVDVLMDVVEPYAGTVARAVHGGRVELIFTVPAENLRQAVITATSVVLATGHTPYALEVLPTDEFHRRIDSAPVPELLSAAEAADELGVSRTRVLQLVNGGQLDGVKVGDTWVVPRTAVVQRAAERRTARIVLSCDGHRHGQPCRGALPTRWRAEHRAVAQAMGAGWRIGLPGTPDLCPSRGHDEETEP